MIAAVQTVTTCLVAKATVFAFTMAGLGVTVGYVTTAVSERLRNRRTLRYFEQQEDSTGE